MDADASTAGDIEAGSRPLLPFPFAKRCGAYVVEDAGRLSLYHKPMIAHSVVAEIQRFLGKPFSCNVVDEKVFDARLTQAYESRNTEAMQMVEDLGDEMDLARLADSVPESEDLLEQEDDAPIIRLINALLTEAVKENASDIHIETFEKRLVVRYRVDGVLREVVEPKRVLAPLLVSRIKVMAKLDIAEKRVPQDGRISIRIGGREIDLRVSTMPSSNGERVVMRLLDKQAGRLKLTSLGMGREDLERMRVILKRPHGIVLVTGPTGSGKTTTLYAGLTELNHASRNILTVEDPIEYNLEGIGQTQVNNKADMTFARGLRAMLRQDPDVVMVGEIRDIETADIAVQASLTGHLVLSTLHTNTAIGAITRMYDMGVEPFLLSSSLVGLVAQRLVRVLCPDCKEPYLPDAKERKLLGIEEHDPHSMFRPVGCPKCNNLGYRGRRGIYEVVSIDGDLRRMIHDQSSEEDMVRQARKTSRGIMGDGISKVLAGLTTVEEILRVTQEG
ncbi:MAG: type II secretion system ATPase GspE [Pseudomonadales bacterium]|nr:type II secretion system ATPase GspE [Pseudomonadales bacterium]NNM10664.1 type II secretion system ATPase GspE [Pseudomonadales bacterium]